MLAPVRTVIATRATPQICSRCIAAASRRAYSQRITTSTPRSSAALRTFRGSTRPVSLHRSFATSPRLLASSPTATEAMETIESLYENATEEFQIAAEETEGNTVYASDDREAARAEVDKLQDFYKSVVDGTGYEQSVREEVRRRAGGRVRELVNAMAALEEKALEHD